MPIDYRSLYGKEWLGSWDLQDKDVTVTITHVAGGELTGGGGRKTKKPVLSIRGTEKKLALNATNGKTIAGLYGPMIENWVGKRIALYKSTTRSPDGSGDVDCIRVRPRVPGAKVVDEPQISAPPPEPPPARAFSEVDEPAQSVADATLDLERYRDVDSMADYANTLSDEIRNDERFAKAFKARLDEIRAEHSK